MFSDSEDVFRRFETRHFANGELLPAAVPFPRASVNRSKYSRAEDVLFSDDGGYDGHGVFAFASRDLPKGVDRAGTPFDFALEHVPLESNYSHSELACSSPLRQVKPDLVPSKTAKSQFRADLSKRLRIVIEARA